MSRNILQGLVGAWCPSLGPSGYTLLDRSGRGNHGTLTARTGTVDAGVVWSAKSPGVCGTLAANQYWSVTSNPAFNFTGPFTALAWWISSGANTADATILAKLADTTSPQYNGWGALLGSSSNSVLSAYWATAVRATGATNVMDGKLHLVGIAWTGGTAEVWVDGKLDGSGATTTAPAATTENLLVGAYTYTGDRTARGSYFEAACWNRRLTPAEHAAYYNGGAGFVGRLLTQRAQRRVFRTQQGNRRRRLICGAEC